MSEHVEVLPENSSTTGVLLAAGVGVAFLLYRAHMKPNGSDSPLTNVGGDTSAPVQEPVVVSALNADLAVGIESKIVELEALLSPTAVDVWSTPLQSIGL